jgi:predicted DNA-binding transcriptional regulator AlpA
MRRLSLSNLPSKKPEPIDRLLSERQVADYLGVSVSALRRWRKAGKAPPSIRLGFAGRSLLRFRTTDVELWLQDRTEQSN